MRWMWIDKFTQFESGKRAVAIKANCLAEDHLHDLYPDYPIVPQSLLIEGMAQTAGLLVGEANGYKEKVVLAKIGRATFERLVRAGQTVEFEAVVEQLNHIGASISGVIRIISGPEKQQVGTIELMFSHIDNNISGTKFPAHNFVFTEHFTRMVSAFGEQTEVKI